MTLDVSVMRDNRPVPGLLPPDFAVTDNGVPQRVERVSFEDVPIDVTLLLDVSGSMSEMVGRVRRDAERIVSTLRPTDRVRILAFDSYVYELVPLRTVGGGLPLPDAPQQGVFTSVFDGFVAALTMQPDPNRRRLVIALTDGGDTFSVNTMPLVRELARRADAVLHIVILNSASSRSGKPPLPSQRGDLTAPFRIVPGARTLKEMALTAEETGGTLHQADPAGWRDVNPVDIFTRVFNEFRQSYVIQFTPTGVSESGWHDLSVTTPRINGAAVRAREVYFAGAP